MMKIYYGAGHGKYTPGKRSPSGKFEEREWFFNDEVARAFAKEMNKYKGVTLVRTDDSTGNTDVPLSTRTNKANNAKADVYISFHHNAFKSKWGNHTGTEVFYSKGSTKGLALAKVVAPVVAEAYGLRNRGVKNNNLYITRETRMPAILIEGGFMDSNIDIKKLRNKSVLRKAGKAVAQAVANHYNLKKGASSGGTATSHTKVTKKSKSVPQMASDVIAGKHGSGHVNRRRSLGISDAQYQKVRAEVNERAGVTTTSKPKGKSVTTMAKEVINGQHGNGHAARRKSLNISQAQYNKVRAKVNELASGKSSKPKNTPNTNQLADKIINSSNAPQGNEARRKWLGVSKATYDKVRKEINRRYS